MSTSTVMCSFTTRFSILTPHITRFEYSPSAAFEDRATLTFLRRASSAPPAFAVANGTEDDSWCNITVFDHSGNVAVETYLRKSEPLKSLHMRGKGWSWSGLNATTSNGNLNGTIAGIGGVTPTSPSPDLSKCCRPAQCVDARAGLCGDEYALQPGLLSKDGWAVIDDSKTAALDYLANNASAFAHGAIPLEEVLRRSWLSERPRVAGNTDIYLLGCGRAYRQCLSEYTSLAGPIALPPLSALGVWWSRHWGDMSGSAETQRMIRDVGVMSEANVQSQVLDGYERRGLPLHVLVLDMEWHEQMDPQSGCTAFAGVKQWGGYSWNRTLFKDPAAFIAKLHASRGELGVRLAVNYHASFGVNACQERYDSMAKWVGVDPASRQSLPDLLAHNLSVPPFSYMNRTYVEGYFKYLVEPTGADYAWLDEVGSSVWVNDLYVRATEVKDVASALPSHRAKRGLNFARYGGLGSHRTPIGFSGDTIRLWSTLQYEVFMTPRASNVAFGWWSHDIGGFRWSTLHQSYVDNEWHTEGPELFLRWLQFGSLAPIFRTHCSYCEQRIWTWSKYDNETRIAGVGFYPLMRETMLLRNALVPYIYTHAALRTHKHGESLLTPMYWDPAAEAHAESYSHLAQQAYFFGRDLLASPVTDPVSPTNGTVTKSVWLPPLASCPQNNATWVEWGSWHVVGTSLSTISRTYTLAGTPLFARAGAVIPTRDMASAYAPMADPLLWLVVPGAAQGNGDVYEDDGGVRHLPRAASCDGRPLNVAPPGTASGFWLEPDVAPDVKPGATASSLVVACGGLATATSHRMVVQL